jgi:hypothetical protein
VRVALLYLRGGWVWIRSIDRPTCLLALALRLVRADGGCLFLCALLGKARSGKGGKNRSGIRLCVWWFRLGFIRGEVDCWGLETVPTHTHIAPRRRHRLLLLLLSPRRRREAGIHPLEVQPQQQQQQPPPKPLPCFVQKCACETLSRSNTGSLLD